MNDREFSEIEIFQHSGKKYRCLWPVIKIVCKPITTVGGLSSVLKTERNNKRCQSQWPISKEV